MFSWFKKASPDDENLLRGLGPGGITVLSASCCDARAQQLDTALQERIRSACEASGVAPERIQFETITRAQSALPRIATKLDVPRQALVKKVSMLFMTSGVDVFPMVIIDGDLAFYGGVPEQTDLESKLRDMPSA